MVITMIKMFENLTQKAISNTSWRGLVVNLVFQQEQM